MAYHAIRLSVNHGGTEKSFPEEVFFIYRHVLYRILCEPPIKFFTRRITENFTENNKEKIHEFFR